MTWRTITAQQYRDGDGGDFDEARVERDGYRPEIYDVMTAPDDHGRIVFDLHDGLFAVAPSHTVYVR